MDNSNKKQIIAEAKRIEEDANFSSKSHFYEWHRWKRLNFWLWISAAVISAIAAWIAISDLSWKMSVVSLLSVLNGAFMAAIAFMSPWDRHSQHLAAGNKYLELRNDARIFSEIRISLSEATVLFEQLERLNARRSELNSSSPQVSKRSFESAREWIESGESTYAN